MNLLMTGIALCISVFSFAQNTDRPFVRLTEPRKTQISVNSARQFVIGSTCKTCSVTINGEEVNVYPTGAFAYELNLKSGDTEVNVIAFTAPDKSANRKLSYTYTIPPPPEPVKTLDIASVETFPEGNLFVMPGDRIKIKVKALAGCTVMANGNIPLFEMPDTDMPGIYQGEYIVKETDSFLVTHLSVTVTDKENRSVTKQSRSWVSMFSPLAPNVAVTKGRLAHLLFGLGDDRLGGAKIGYLDSAVQLHIVGKVDKLYKVQLGKNRLAYIDDDAVEFLPKGTFTPESLTNRWSVYGDGTYDYIQLGLSTRLPYQSFQLVDPSKIVVDIFGATNNTNWINHLENAREIKNLSYEQVEEGIFRITIELNHRQHWGHSIYYNGNTMVIRVKQQPANLSLSNLRIGVDAGHGGRNTGAGGPTESSEKMLTLALSLKLQKALEAEGARVIMTRTRETYVDNHERILLFRDSMPDLLLSIHLNSTGDPIRIRGTSTFYRHIGFRNLSYSIYKRMLELGLDDMGNNGSFNFMLNSPTEYPNALVETLFLSNPADEALILDEGFQHQVVNKIVQGIRDFLKSCN